jgi:hypothetical protein
MCNSTLFDFDMFKAVWKPVISTIAHAFITFDDEYVIQRAISGFRQCATLAGHFNLPDVFDFVVVSLSQATSLLSENLPARVPNYPVIAVEEQSVTVSSLSVKFGTNFKGQLAAVVLFNIVNGNGNALREGWTQVTSSSITVIITSANSIVDFRDVWEPIYALLAADEDVANGEFPRWSHNDSVARCLPIKASSKERGRFAFDPVIIPHVTLWLEFGQPRS